MPLSPGARLGPYDIIAPLGAGGMGEVYRARDTKLDREVAIKVLPAAVAQDKDRLARFEREAKVLASLNHPCIAQIYGLEENALVMELVAGSTLSVPQPIETALNYAKQIAEALEAAHEKGITHRDLKPANIMITPEGVAKVLDFGLATVPIRETHGNPESSPTMTMAATQAGMIMGTAAYMSPEQAAGKAVDKRSDIWSFGVVLFEMLTGRRLFDGETTSHILADVLRAEIDFKALPTATPRSVRTLLRRCLDRNVRNRLRDIGEARVVLDEALKGGIQEGQAPPPSKWTERLGWIAAAVSIPAAVVLAFLLMLHETPEPPPVTFTVNTPENGSLILTGRPQVSPNGEYIAYPVLDSISKRNQLNLHSLATGADTVLPGAEEINGFAWNFDSRSLLLFHGDEILKVDINAGSQAPLPVSIEELSSGSDRVVTFTGDGVRLYGAGSKTGRIIKAPDPKTGLFFGYPSLIPGSRWLVYNSYSARGMLPSGGVSVQLASIDGREDRNLFTIDRAALYAQPGYLLYLRGANLTAQAIDPGSGKLRGGPRQIAGPVNRAIGSPEPGAFTFSRNGVLAFVKASGAVEQNLVWFDRSGKRLGTVAGAADYSNPALSPDENRLAIGIRDPVDGKRGIWILDLQRGAASRITFDSSDNLDPLWSPDGTRIAFSSDRHGVRDLYSKNASGTGDDELLLSSQVPKNAEDWSRDGRWIVFNEQPSGDADLAVLALEGRKPANFLRTKFSEDHARFSPDGKWMAYQSNESGRNEIYVQAFPATVGKWQISNSGGNEPQWRGDGRELYYTSLENPTRIMAVDISVKDQAIVAGIPRPLFEVTLPAGLPRNRWVVTRDGKKFLAIVPSEQKPINSFTVIVNWPSLLPKR